MLARMIASSTYPWLRLVGRAICAALLGVALSGCTTTPPASLVMRTAEAVPPPLGYIDFCARFPDQCGPETRRMADVMTAPRGGNAVASRKYFWLAAFDGTAPGSVGKRSGNTPDGAFYNWRKTFDAVHGATIPSDEGGAAPVTLQAKAGGSDTDASTPHMTQEFWSLLEQVNRDVNARIRPVHDLDQYGFEDYWTLPIKTGTLAGDCKDYVLEKRRLLMEHGVPMSDLSITLGTTAWGEYHAVLLVHTDRGDYVMDNLSPWVTSWKDVTYTWSKRQSAANPDIWVRPIVADN